MPNYNKATQTTETQKNGYSPKGYVTQVVKGRTVNIPVSELKINPPKAGTAAVTPKK
jgi:outer membrane lipoprotein-sorting protein